MWFLAIGLLFHLFYLWSIFDIYFVSPLVHGMSQVRSTSSPPAKRLFLIVGDGLRADTTFDVIEHPVTGEKDHLAPFLRDIVLNKGTYGISHTRMPTESRPGHVAMIAGFYEDVSAVTKGWKENPVDFDSTLNQSVHTYSFGSPDILPMFEAGASDANKIDTWMYGHEFEDFSKSSIELDKFVFDHLDQLFLDSETNKTLKAQIHQDGNIFFLHLLGMDTAGHSYRPYSAEYYDNLKYIDSKLTELVPKIHSFFGDDDTLFIFTADHGMSAFGSHGDGHPNNTRTPLICWGAGINKPVKLEEPVFDEYTEPWNLHNIKRNDVAQADIASLMSYLVGINYAANSVGELPLAYIDASEEQKLKALYANAQAILKQYYVKEEELRNTQFNFKPFQHFETTPVAHYETEIERLMKLVEDGKEEYEQEAIRLVEELMKNTLTGLDYLTKYNWLLLRTIVTFGFLGWIVYSFINFLELFILQRGDYSSTTSFFNYVFYIGLTISMNYILFYQKSPFNYYVYLMFPIFFFQKITSNFDKLKDGISLLFKNISTMGRILAFFSILGIYEGVVYGFFNRIIFTYLFFLLALYPPVFLRSQVSISQTLMWIITCLIMSTFTTFDAVKTESLSQINMGAGMMVIIAFAGYFKVNSKLSPSLKKFIVSQILLLIISIYTTNSAVISLQAKEGLGQVTQILNWTILLASMVIMPFVQYTRIELSHHYKVKMLVIFLTFAPYFNILTISFENIFYATFSLLLYQFIHLEKPGGGNLQLIRVSTISFFLLEVCFFGTGNISSISAFSLDSVYRLIPIFSPFIMGALLMIKLIIPYLLLSIELGVMNESLKLGQYAISSLLISTNEILSLNFFYLVKTTGSWLDIGVTISNFVIGVLSSLFMIIIEVLSNYILGQVELDHDLERKNQ